MDEPNEKIKLLCEAIENADTGEHSELYRMILERSAAYLLKHSTASLPDAAFYLGNTIKTRTAVLLEAVQTIRAGGEYDDRQKDLIREAGSFLIGKELTFEQALAGLQEIRPEELQQVAQEVPHFKAPDAKSINAFIADATRGSLAELADSIQNGINRANFYNLQKEFEALRESVREYLAKTLNTPAGRIYAEVTGELAPFIDKELQDPKYNGATIAELYDSAERDANGEPLANSLLMQAVKAARAAAVVELERPALPAIIVRDIPELQYMMDKGNRNLWGPIWNTLASSPPGQQTFLFNMANSEDKRLKIDLPLMVSINFNELNGIQVTKKLTSFDKRVYTAVASLYNAENENLPVQTIYKHMGYKGRAGTTDKEKIRNSLLKMMGALITIDNSAEASRYNYPHYRYHGALIYAEIIEKCEVNGGIADGVFHILKEPALMAFARGRDQIATVSLEMLQTPLSKTEENLSIEDYLIWRIKRAKHKKEHGSHKINYTKIFEATGIPTEPKTDADRKRKKRAPEKIKELLDYYRQIGEISRHKEQKDSITIFW